jgi:hypothetical protein
MGADECTVYGTWYTDAWTAAGREAGFVRLFYTMMNGYTAAMALSLMHQLCENGEGRYENGNHMHIAQRSRPVLYFSTLQ